MEGSGATSDSETTQITTPSEPRGDVVFLNQSEAVDGIPSSLDSGVLSVDAEGCLRMQSRVPGGPPFAPVWPPGYSLDAVEGGPARILDGEGGVVARVRDEVRVGGGPASSLGAVVDANEPLRRKIRERRPGPYFLLGEVVSVRRG